MVGPRPAGTCHGRPTAGRNPPRTARTRSPCRREPATDRPDPVALPEEQAGNRVPDLIPIRYGPMLVSPFTFYQGAALIMAAGHAATPAAADIFLGWQCPARPVAAGQPA